MGLAGAWPIRGAAFHPMRGRVFLSRHRRRLAGAAGLAMLAAIVGLMGGAAAETAERPKLFTHESYVDDVLRTTALPLDDPRAMFAYVLGALPDRVKVYPTENYYYFKFVTKGAQYAGNIRLDVSDRDQGKVHFAYYEDLAEWKDESPVTHVVLDKTQGVSVERLDRLVYRVSSGDKTVVFQLNDLSTVVPPASTIGADERYVGPVFDDSAIRFFLVYNSKLKIFHYILDETVKVADRLVPTRLTDRILIGQRTGFAFYRDAFRDRKILIGVFEGNGRINNYFDGPFDQLPDNFIAGDTLRNIILEIEPGLAGKIDRLGGSRDGESRFLISPYLYYRTEEDLAVFHTCATSKTIPRESYYACFVIEQDEDDAERSAPPKRGTSKKTVIRKR
jgi:hypothetical protein